VLAAIICRNLPPEKARHTSANGYRFTKVALQSSRMG
jgi:hypothetical protein